MKPTTSPWLHQLRERVPYALPSDRRFADAAIVGAGISGVSAAYFILRHTDASVFLLDSGLIARGATGRNAGHVVSEFERPLPDILREFGKDRTLAAVTEIESGWDLLEEMLTLIGREAYDDCSGYNGFITVERLLQEIHTHAIRAEAGVEDDDPIMVVDDRSIVKCVPKELLRFVRVAPRSEIIRLLHTDDERFIAVETTHIGCMNSALFCERLVEWMLGTYADRFAVAENLRVTKLILGEPRIAVEAHGRSLEASHVVLCTNGYAAMPIVDPAGVPVKGLRTEIEGMVGFMTGYLDDKADPAAAITYYDPDEFYLTRRRFTEQDCREETLISAGGCEVAHCGECDFDPLSSPIAPRIQRALAREIKHTYNALPATARHAFLWQGLQGYTKNTVRRVGFDPLRRALLHNTGCNGIGILPALAGGRRIARLLAGESLPPSIFDPKPS